MRHSAWFLAPVIGIVAGLSSARGDTVETDDPWNPWWLRIVTQVPVTLTPSKAFLAPPATPETGQTAGHAGHLKMSRSPDTSESDDHREERTVHD